MVPIFCLQLQDSLSSMTQALDQAAIWGESLAMSAKKLSDKLFRRFQMDSMALMNRYLQMAERGEDPDQHQHQQQYQVMQPPQQPQPQPQPQQFIQLSQCP